SPPYQPTVDDISRSSPSPPPIDDHISSDPAASDTSDPEDLDYSSDLRRVKVCTSSLAVRLTSNSLCCSASHPLSTTPARRSTNLSTSNGRTAALLFALETLTKTPKRLKSSRRQRQTRTRSFSSTLSAASTCINVSRVRTSLILASPFHYLNS